MVRLINYCNFRTFDPSKRPTFMEITTLLQKPDFQVLKWSREDWTTCSEEARTLGAALETGTQLHKDLQKMHAMN